MKIAINALVMDQNRAGVGNYAYHLLQYLQQTPLPFSVDAYVNQEVAGEFADTKTFRVVPCGPFSGSAQRIWFEQCRLPGLLRKGDYALVHFLDYSAPWLPLSVPFWVTVHDISFLRYPQNYTRAMAFYKKQSLPLSLRRAERVITVSEFTKREILDCFSLPPEQITAVPLGVEPPVSDGLTAVLLPKRLRGLEPYVLFVGTLEPRKNVLTLLKAMEELWEAGFPHRLVLAGKPGWLYRETVAYAENSRFSDRIIRTGYLCEEELELLYRGASVFAYPSFYEGFGLPPLEAMRWGVPVVSSPCASLPEVLGDAALYAQAEDPSAWAQAIRQVLEDDVLRSRLMTAGEERAATRLWSHMGQATVELYQRNMR